MKTKLDCYPCFLRIALQAARLSGADEELQTKIMTETLGLLQKPLDIESPLRTAKQVQDIVTKCNLVSQTLTEMSGKKIETGDWIFWNGKRNHAVNE